MPGPLLCSLCGHVVQDAGMSARHGCGILCVGDSDGGIAVHRADVGGTGGSPFDRLAYCSTARAGEGETLTRLRLYAGLGCVTATMGGAVYVVSDDRWEVSKRLDAHKRVRAPLLQPLHRPSYPPLPALVLLRAAACLCLVSVWVFG